MTGLPGVIMIGVGVAPAKVPEETKLQFAKMGAVWSTLSGVNLKTELFFPFIGVCKIIGVAGMWGLFGDTAEVAIYSPSFGTSNCRRRSSVLSSTPYYAAAQHILITNAPSLYCRPS